MRPGLRLQILLLLGLLLGLAFAPLYFAISTYTEVAIARAAARAARQLGNATAAFVANTELPPRAVEATLFAHQEGAERVLVAALYGTDGNVDQLYGPPPLQHLLPARFSGAANVTPTQASRDSAEGPQRMVVSAETERGRAAVLVQFEASEAVPLNRLLGLYITLIGLALLVGAHFSLTVLIVRPLDQISRAASRVASTDQPLQLPTTRSAELTGLAASLQTMTERLKNDELALRRKVEELEQAQTQLGTAQAQLVRSERLASVGQLAAGLAHEIGNPLAAMQGLQDLILEGDLDPEQQLDFTRRMRKETQRINRILRDLLDFARPEPQPDHDEHGDLGATIQETLALLEPQPRLRQVELLVDVPGDLPKVQLGHNRLMQIVLNLLLNAVDACDGAGRITLRAELAATDPASEPFVRLTVQDNGPGVPAALVDRLFEPFVSSKEVGEGSGLGLSVCKGLIESVGGKIWLDAANSEGARFVVELPARAADAS